MDIGVDGGELSAARSGHFTSMKEQPVHIEYEAGWFPETAWAFWIRENLMYFCKCDGVRGFREHPVAVVNDHSVFGG